MNIKETRLEVIKNMSKIPKWIDTTSSLHFLVWNTGMLSINDQILKLITNNLLTERVVFNIYNNVNELLDNLSDVTTSDIQSRVLVYYSKLFIYLEDISIYEEIYEVAANLKKFTDLYYNIKIIK